MAYAQQAGLPTRPPLTASGVQVAQVIQAGLRASRLNARRQNAGPEQAAPVVSPPVTAPPVNVAPVTAPLAATAAPAVAQADGDFYAKLDTAIDVSSRRYLTANVHSPWQIFHGLLALKQDFKLNLAGTKVNAIEWIATSEPRFDNQPLLMKTPHGGKFHSFTRPYAFEGHPAQFLALMSQSDLPVGYAFKVGDDRITVGDIVNNTMKEVNNREEVTWVLWALQHYLRPDTQWVNQFNEPWSIERLVQLETAAPVNGAPCGGNHRLFALTRTRDKHLKHGGQLVGIWAQADYKIRQHIEIARSLQNYDGSFSARFYETSGHTTDLNQRFNTSGHTMEFLSVALPDQRLEEPWVRSAVSALCSDLIANRQRQIDCGPLYHTLNSLIIYRERTLSKRPSVPQQPQVADSTAGADKRPGIPSLSPMPTPALASLPGAGLRTVEEKPVIDIPPADASLPSKSSESTQPSAEALNELKLEGESRAKLNALTAPRPFPALVPPNSSARPLGATGEPVLPVEQDIPASALNPENMPVTR